MKKKNIKEALMVVLIGLISLAFVFQAAAGTHSLSKWENGKFDLVFPLRDLLDMYKVMGVKKIRRFIAEVFDTFPFEPKDYFYRGDYSNPHDWIKTVRCVPLQMLEFAYGGEEGVMPIYDHVSDPLYFLLPHEWPAWIGTGQGKNVYKEWSKVLMILERDFLMLLKSGN